MSQQDEQERETNLLRHPLIVRLAEAAIIGGIVVWVSVQRMEMRTEELAKDLNTLQETAEKIDGRMRVLEQEVWRVAGMRIK